MMQKKGNLSEKERRFCLHYFKTGNATEASKVAGYNCSNDLRHADNGCNVLKRPKIAKHLTALREEEAKRVKVDIQYVTNGIVEIINIGKETGQINVALKGYELIGKHLGYFEKDNKRVFMHNINKIAQATDDELMDIIGELTI